MEKKVIIKAPEEQIATNGFYLFSSKTGTIFYRILLVLDVILYGILYLIFGLLSSYVINEYLTSDKGLPSNTNHPNKSKEVLFLEVILEIIYTIIVLFFTILILGNLPSIAGETPQVHKIIRFWAGSIILIFAIITLQTKLTEKLLYIFNE